MRPLYGTTYNQNGYVEINSSASALIGNAVTMFIAGNRRPGFSPKHPYYTIEALLYISRKEPVRWNELTAGDQTITAGVSLDANHRLQELSSSEIGGFIKAMLDTPERVRNIGRELALALTGAKNEVIPVDDIKDPSKPKRSAKNIVPSAWTTEQVVMPASGIPMTWYGPSGTAEGLSRYALNVPSPCSSWSRQIAFMCAAMDRSKWTLSLVPPVYAKSIEGHDSRERPFGEYKAFVSQVESIQSLGILYSLQPMLFYVHANAKRWKRYLLEIERSESFASEAVEQATNAIDYCLSIPLHPVLSYSLMCTNRVKAETRLGPHELYAYTYVGGENDLTLKPQEGFSVTRAVLDSIVGQTIANEADDWGHCVESANSAAIGVIQLMRSMKSIPRYFEKFTELVGKLGWDKYGEEEVVLSHGAADFTMTDGQRYSSGYGRSALGWSPTLSLGNKADSGIDRRFDAKFNAKPEAGGYGRIRYSVCTVDGYQAPSSDELALLRKYRPLSTTMGEDNYVIFGVSPLNAEPELAVLIGKIKARIGSITVEVPDPTDPTKNTTRSFPALLTALYGLAKEHKTTPEGFKRTDWDAYAIGENPSRVIAAFTDGYSDWMQPIEMTYFAFAKDSRFFHRFPVRLSRAEHIDFYDTELNYISPFEFDGHVLFDGEVALGANPRPAEQLISYAGVGATASAKAAAAAEGEQIEVTGGKTGA